MIKGGRKEGESELRPTVFGLCDCVNTLSRVTGVPLVITEALERLYITTDIGETIPVSNLVDDGEQQGCKRMVLHNDLVDIGFIEGINGPALAGLRYRVGENWWMNYSFYQNKAILSVISGRLPAILEVEPTVLPTDPITEGYIFSSPAGFLGGKKFGVTQGEGIMVSVKEADNEKRLREEILTISGNRFPFEFCYSVDCLEAGSSQHNRLGMLIGKRNDLGGGFHVELEAFTGRESLSVALDSRWHDFKHRTIIERALYKPDTLARSIGLKVEPKKLSAMVLANGL